jgi:hypothetical protein
VDVVHPLTRNRSRRGLLVLSSFSHRSPHEAPPHGGLLRWASIVDLPLGQSWVIKGALEQVDQVTPVSRTPTVAPGSLACKRALSRERRVRAPRRCWALQRHASTHAVRGPCEDVELQTRGATAVGEMKQHGDHAP